MNKLKLSSQALLLYFCSLFYWSINNFNSSLRCHKMLLAWQIKDKQEKQQPVSRYNPHMLTGCQESFRKKSCFYTTPSRKRRSDKNNNNNNSEEPISFSCQLTFSCDSAEKVWQHQGWCSESAHRWCYADLWHESQARWLTSTHSPPVRTRPALPDSSPVSAHSLLYQ